MKKILLTILLAQCVILPSLAQHTTYPSVAILQTYDPNNVLKEQENAELRYLFLEALMNMGYDVFDKEDIKFVVDEVDRQQHSALVDKETAVRLGQQIGCKYLFTITISGSRPFNITAKLLNVEKGGQLEKMVSCSCNSYTDPYRVSDMIYEFQYGKEALKSFQAKEKKEREKLAKEQEKQLKEQQKEAEKRQKEYEKERKAQERKEQRQETWNSIKNGVTAPFRWVGSGFRWIAEGGGEVIWNDYSMNLDYNSAVGFSIAPTIIDPYGAGIHLGLINYAKRLNNSAIVWDAIGVSLLSEGVDLSTSLRYHLSDTKLSFYISGSIGVFFLYDIYEFNHNNGYDADDVIFNPTFGCGLAYEKFYIGVECGPIFPSFGITMGFLIFP